MSDQFQQAVLADGFEPHCYSGRGRNVYRKGQEIDGERLYGVFEVGQLTLDGVAEPLDVLVVSGSANRRGFSPCDLVAIALNELKADTDDQSTEKLAAVGALLTALQNMEARDRLRAAAAPVVANS